MSEATRTIDGTVLPAAGTWNIDPVHSHIEFTVRHLVIGKTRGRFDTFTGTVQIAEEPTASSVTLDIDATSVNTKDENRDNHLRSADFLDVETYPKISFASKTVTGKGNDWVLEGDPEHPSEPPEVVIWVHRDVPPEGPEADRTDWNWSLWRGQAFQGDVCNMIWMHSMYGGANGR